MWFAEIESGPIRVLYAERHLIAIVNRVNGHACRVPQDVAEIIDRQQIFFQTSGWSGSLDTVPIMDETTIRQVIAKGIPPPLETPLSEIMRWAAVNGALYKMG